MKEENKELLLRLSASRIVNLGEIVGQPIAGAVYIDNAIFLKLGNPANKWVCISTYKEEDEFFRHPSLDSRLTYDCVLALAHLRLLTFEEARGWKEELDRVEDAKMQIEADKEFARHLEWMQQNREFVRKMLDKL